MKKIIVLLIAALMLTACSKDDEPVGNKTFRARIVKLYDVVMRRELPYPFSAYVMELDNGSHKYMMRMRYNYDLHEGDEIVYRVFDFCPSEICAINGVELGDGDDGGSNANVQGGLVASDPIEAVVADVFYMDIRYSLTLLPISSVFIETEAGNLVYVKKAKLSVALTKGDRIVYNVYSLFPNEVLAIKKLR